MKTVARLTNIAVAVGIVCFAAVNCAAEDALKEGAWALQFEINGDFDLTSFQGSTISLKQQKSDGVAYRLGLDIAIHTRSADADQDQVREDSRPDRIYSSIGTSSSDRNSQSLRLALQRIAYPARTGPVKLFYGFGPLVGFVRTHEDATTDSYDEAIILNDPPDTSHAEVSHTERTTTQKNWSVGFLGVLGVEWFVNSSISLLAEYSSSLEYTWTKSTLDEVSRAEDGGYVSHRTSNGDTDSIDFGAGAVKFGLSAYF